MGSQLKKVIMRESAFSFKIATSEEDLDKVFRVRFEVFAGDGYLDPSKYPDGREKDGFDNLPTTNNFLALDGDKGIGTVRLLEPNPMIAEREGWDLGIDMEHLFDLSYYKLHKIRIAEIPRSSLLKEYRGTTVMMQLWGTAVRYALSKDITHFCAVGNTETDDVTEAKIIYHVLLQKGAIHPEIKTPPKVNAIKNAPSVHRLYSEVIAKLEPSVALEGKYPSQFYIPTTLDVFLRLGLKVTGMPVYTSQFDRFEIPLVYDLLHGMTLPARRYFLK